MNKNLILVFILMAVVVIISQQFLFKKVEQQPKVAPTEQQQSATPAQSTSAPATPVAPPPGPAGGVKQASGEQETVVENDFYKITFTNKGGLVKSWVLKKFKDDKGNPLELVGQQAASQFGFPSRSTRAMRRPGTS